MKTLGGIFYAGYLCLTPVNTGLYQSSNENGPVSTPNSSGEPAQFQIVISEIMADPKPPAGLPDVEYIELYNRGESSVSLEGCRLAFGKNQKILPAVTFGPNTYLVVCDAGGESHFTSQVNLLPIRNMPPILNTGQVITLKSPSGMVIHSVEFDTRWYRSGNKAEGGWSLEMIDPDNPCGREENWCESIDPDGGSPGFRNSVNGINPDRLKPKLLRATMNADSSVLLHFNESMDSASMDDPSCYSANHGLLHPVRIDPVEPGYNSIALDFGTRLNSSVPYTLTVLNSLKDCAGNPLAYNARVGFAIPQPSDSFEVVINEVLFDTPAEMSEFIELYNRSGQTIDLAEFSLALCDPFSDSIIRQTPLKNNSFLLLPGCYVAITKLAEQLPNPANKMDPANVVEQPALFILPDKEGEIALVTTSLHIIDRFRYSTRMHSDLLSETEGISLERIRADLPTNDISNWYSAASLAGYATPGYENSQGMTPGQEQEIIEVAPAVFSPDGDNTDDVAVLTLKTGKPGFIANIQVFDRRGIVVKTLTPNTLLGTETILTWDGFCNDQTEAEPGIYLFYIEIFNQTGEVKKYRKVVTLARKL